MGLKLVFGSKEPVFSIFPLSPPGERGYARGRVILYHFASGAYLSLFERHQVSYKAIKLFGSKSLAIAGWHHTRCKP